MTFVLRKKKHVLDMLTGGQSSIDLRIPHHPLIILTLEEIHQLLIDSADNVTILSFTKPQYFKDTTMRWIKMPETAKEYAYCLYDALRLADERAPSMICIEKPPRGDEWLSIHDRLKRASLSK